VFTGLPHGAFFGVASVVAADMVPIERRATAISMIFAGLTVANVLGVPLGTLFSQHVGWRATFCVLVAIGVVSLAAIARLVPSQPPPTGATLRSELAIFRRPQVWLALSVGTFGFGGVSAAYCYIEPMMIKVAGYSPAAVDWLFALFGVGMTVGNLVGGRLADRALMPSLYASLGSLGLVMALFVLTAHYQMPAAVTIFLIGATSMACVPIIQTRIMDKAYGAPTLAAAANQSAFNLASAGGAFLGGLAIEAGFGLTSLNWLGAVLAALGLGLAVLSGALDRGGSQSRGARSKSNSVGNVAQRAGACGSDHASLRN
jgi:DHA1 family inner membrane transport protein